MAAGTAAPEQRNAPELLLYNKIASETFTPLLHPLIIL